jgi:NAD(P)-dependent dehydrogenase (short-subunit alcohol dehydrogenase family)
MTFEGLAGAALVIGGTGAVGQEACRMLARRGSDVVLTFRSSQHKANALVEEIEGLSRRVAALRLSPVDIDASRALVDKVADHYGGIHTLIYAGGPFVPQQYLSQTSPGQFRSHVEQEVVSFFNIVQPAIRHLRETKGTIVAVTSVANRRFPPRDGLSSGPKGGIESVVRALALEEGRHGIRANSVGPGLLQDGMAAQLIEDGSFSDAAQTAAVNTIPLRRFGRAYEVAEVAVFLASAAAAYVTGQIIDVDGGYQL